MLEERDILSIVTSALSNSETYNSLEVPLDYYLGNPNGKEVEGRSTVVSTDVADAIEWIMPQIMKAFTQNNEVIVFDPLGPGDEAQAELESQYVYDVLMKENDGFIILHQFVKDALLHNNGIIKVFYDQSNEIEVQSFSGLTEEQVIIATQSPNVEVIEHAQVSDGTFMLKIAITTPNGKVTLESIPPEQFRYNNDHNSINLDKAKFTAHVFQKTVSDLLEDGYSPELLDSISDSYGDWNSDFRFTAQNEPGARDSWDNEDPSMRELSIAECFMRIDINGDGIAEYAKITVAGYESPTHVLSVEEMSYSPWIATTGILMSHKFRGLSIYDRLRQIQDQKTALLRNILDNVYLQNNQRNVVVEGQVNMDDMLVSRPGGIIRAKRIDAILPLQTPPLGQDAFNMMQYLDSVRAGRVGVAPEGEVTPQRIGERVGSEGVAELLATKEELVGLIVRVIAETGLKPLCTKIRDICIRHVDAVQNYKFRGVWTKTNPAEWPGRTRATVRVGTGTGNHNKQLTALGQILQIQAQLAQMGSTMFAPDKAYAALNDFCKWNELVSASKYFLDPSSPEGQQAAQKQAEMQQAEAQKQEQANMAMLQAQIQLSHAELQKAKAQQDNVALKAEIEQLKGHLANAKSLAEAAGKDADRVLKKYEIETKAALELTRIEADAKAQQEQNALQNRNALKEQENADVSQV